jgi:ketosteroid isomerase-like protein
MAPEQVVTASAHEDVLRRFFTAWCANDTAGTQAFLADQVVLHYPGTTNLAGDYRGKDAFLSWVQQHGIATGQASVALSKVFTDQDTVVALYASLLQGEQQSFVERSVAVFAVRQGQIAEAWVTPMDLAASDRFRSGAAAQPAQ